MSDKKPPQDGQFSNPDDIAQAILLDYFFDPDPEAPLSKELRSKARYTLASWRQDFYQWTAGRWDRISDAEIDLWITKHLQAHNESIAVSLGESPKVSIHKNLVGNVRLCLGARVLRPERRPLNVWDNIEQDASITLSMTNGLLLLRQDGQVELIEHSPDYFTFVRLPYDYDPGASYQQWEDFLLDVMEGDAERVFLLQQWVGYLLMPSLRQQKFLLIAGEGSNGKGVFFEIVERMLGRENITHIPLAEFGQRFSLSSTLGKLANMNSESSADITAYGENVLKSYTAGDAMSFARKFLDPIECVPSAKIMIACNELPKIQDRTQGIWRRLIFVPFEKIYTEKEQDKNLADKLAMHLSGVFSWAVKGIGLLKESNGFVCPAKCIEALNDYQLRMNPGRGFLQENYEIDPQAEGVPCGEIYKAYTVWCEANGFKPLNSSNFGREIKRMYPQMVKMKKTTGDRRIAIYAGLQKCDSIECVQSANGIDGIPNPYFYRAKELVKVHSEEYKKEIAMPAKT